MERDYTFTCTCTVCMYVGTVSAGTVVVGEVRDFLLVSFFFDFFVFHDHTSKNLHHTGSRSTVQCSTVQYLLSPSK
jgi:hypothetical protein